MITITRQAGVNAVLSGLFLDPATVSPTATPTALVAGRDSVAQAVGMTTPGTPTTRAINALDSPSGTTVAPWPGPHHSILAQRVHDLALEQVWEGSPRRRSVVGVRKDRSLGQASSAP